jgi:hypothetical protein
MAPISKTLKSRVENLLMAKIPHYYKFRIVSDVVGDRHQIADTFVIKGDYIVFYINNLPVTALRDKNISFVEVVAEGTLEELNRATDDSA